MNETVKTAEEKRISANTVKSVAMKLYPFVALFIIVVLFSVWSGGRLLAARNLKTILTEAFRMILGASALAFVISQGAIDLSYGSAIGLCAAIGAISAKAFGPPAVFVTLLVGAVIGLVNGFVHAKLHVNAFITTLSMSFMLGGLLDTILGGGSASVPYSMLNWDSTWLRLITLIVVVAIGYIVFEYGKLGKRCCAVGSNETAARQSGINIANVKMTAYMITGVMAGFLAFFSLIRTGTSTSGTGDGFEMDCMLSLFLGGMPITGGTSAKFRAAIIGGLTMTVLTNGMNVVSLDVLVQQFVRGVIFLAAVALTFNRKTVAFIK